MNGMEQITARRGLRHQIARELGLAPSSVWRWAEVPAERVVDVERITGIPRHVLRPDLHLSPAGEDTAA